MIETSIFFGECHFPTPTIPYRGSPITPNNSQHTRYNKGFVDFQHLDQCGWGEGLPAKELFIHGFVRVEILSKKALEKEQEYIEILEGLKLKRVDFELDFKTVQTLYTQVVQWQDPSNQTLNRLDSLVHHTTYNLDTAPMTFYLYDAFGHTLKRIETTIEHVLAGELVRVQGPFQSPTVNPLHTPNPITNEKETADARKEPDPTLDVDGVQIPNQRKVTNPGPSLEEQILEHLQQKENR